MKAKTKASRNAVRAAKPGMAGMEGGSILAQPVAAAQAAATTWGSQSVGSLTRQ